MNRWRTSIARIAMTTRDKVEYLEKREERMLENMRQADIKNMRRKMGNKLMLDAMQIEYDRYWPTLGTIEQKIDADVIIPQTVLNFGEYQQKLQKLAMLAEQGDNKEMQAVLDNQQVAERKNKLLQPLFREIKSQIRHMSFNPEFELMKEYLSKRTQLERAIEGTKSPEERKAVLGKLKKMYAAILAKR